MAVHAGSLGWTESWPLEVRKPVSESDLAIHMHGRTTGSVRPRMHRADARRRVILEQDRAHEHLFGIESESGRTADLRFLRGPRLSKCDDRPGRLH